MGLKLASLAMTARLPKSVVDFNHRAGVACSICGKGAYYSVALNDLHRITGLWSKMVGKWHDIFFLKPGAAGFILLKSQSPLTRGLLFL